MPALPRPFPGAETPAGHPRLRFDIALDERILDLVGEGFDVAVRSGTLPDSRLIARRLVWLRGRSVASPACLRLHGSPQGPGDLVSHVCMEHSELGPPGHWRFETDRLTVPISRLVRVNSFDTRFELTLAGAGLAILPTFLGVAELASGRLVQVLSDHEIVGRQLHALSPPTQRLAPKVKLFLEALAVRAALPAEAWGLRQQLNVSSVAGLNAYDASRARRICRQMFSPVVVSRKVPPHHSSQFSET